MKPIPMTRRTLAIVLGFAALQAPARAQEAAAGNKLEEITVTATRRVASVQDVPLSVTALGAEALGQAGVMDTRDLVNLAPNLSQQGSFGHTSPSFFIRGVGSTQFNPNANSKVGIYLDDVYLASPAVHGSQIFDLASVEIARGPQGTLFGQNTTAGLVRLITRRPEIGGGLSADARLGVGSDGQFDPELAVGFDTGASSAARISVAQQTRDGYMRNTLRGTDDGDVDVFGWRAQWLWRPAEDVGVLLLAHGSKDDGELAPYKQIGMVDPATFGPCPNPGLGSGCTDFFGYADSTDPHRGQWDVRDQYTDVESKGANLTIDWELEAITLTSVSAWETNESRVHEDPDAGPLFVMTGNYHGEPEQFSQELRLNSTEGSIDWIVGAYYFHENVDTSVGFPIPGFGPGALSGGLTSVPEGLGQISSMDTDSYALFGDAEVDLGDRLTLMLGLRYTHEKKDVDYAAWLADVSTVTPETFFTDRQITDRALLQTIDFRDGDSWDDLSGRASLSWSFSEDVLGYATISRGFNSGNYNGGAFSDQTEATLVDPETLVSYEIGLKSEIADRLRLNLSAFYYDFTDQQVFVLASGAGGVPVQQLSNAAASTLYGFELEAVWQPVEAFTLQVGAGYTHSEFDEFKTPVGEDLSGGTLPSAPETNVNAIATYTVPTSIGAWSLSAGLKYQSKQYFSVNNDPVLSQDGYTIADARLAWTSPGESATIAAWVRNLYDEEYLVGAFDLASFGWNQWVIGEPRTFGITFEYHIR